MNNALHAYNDLHISITSMFFFSVLLLNVRVIKLSCHHYGEKKNLEKKALSNLIIILFHKKRKKKNCFTALIFEKTLLSDKSNSCSPADMQKHVLGDMISQRGPLVNVWQIQQVCSEQQVNLVWKKFHFNVIGFLWTTKTDAFRLQISQLLVENRKRGFINTERPPQSKELFCSPSFLSTNVNVIFGLCVQHNP